MNVNKSKSKGMKTEIFDSLGDVAIKLRDQLEHEEAKRDEAIKLPKQPDTKKNILLFAYNGTGKTRLSTTFKNLGKSNGRPDTLYFNAFTEDLFTWDNDIENDKLRRLELNKKSNFFEGLGGYSMEKKTNEFLNRYADFDFRIDYIKWEVVFSRKVIDSNDGGRKETTDNIKISRGEENIFIWCFFLAIVQLTMNAGEGEPYSWVKYIYIDDPISSLDENNAVAVAHDLAQLLKQEHHLKTVVSTHHSLFFNVLCNELRKKKNKTKKYFLSKENKTERYSLENTGDTPFFYHVAMLVELKNAAATGELYTYHFNILRNILEKTASFHGYPHFSNCLEDPDRRLHARIIDLLNHGNYSLYSPTKMLQENKVHFKNILDIFLENFPFNKDLFPTSRNKEKIKN